VLLNLALSPHPKPQGYGFITFANPSAAQQAMVGAGVGGGAGLASGQARAAVLGLLCMAARPVLSGLGLAWRASAPWLTRLFEA
jgi:hypothetical protein